MVRAVVPNVDSRDEDRFASSRKGSSTSSAFDLPEPFGPRSNSRPWSKVNTSSK